jgi:hypothetical protein
MIFLVSLVFVSRFRLAVTLAWAPGVDFGYSAM